MKPIEVINNKNATSSELEQKVYQHNRGKLCKHFDLRFRPSKVARNCKNFDYNQ